MNFNSQEAFLKTIHIIINCEININMQNSQSLLKLYQYFYISYIIKQKNRRSGFFAREKVYEEMQDNNASLLRY